MRVEETGRRNVSKNCSQKTSYVHEFEVWFELSMIQ